jgi:hypothetical protein
MARIEAVTGATECGDLTAPVPWFSGQRRTCHASLVHRASGRGAAGRASRTARPCTRARASPPRRPGPGKRRAPRARRRGPSRGPHPDPAAGRQARRAHHRGQLARAAPGAEPQPSITSSAAISELTSCKYSGAGDENRTRMASLQDETGEALARRFPCLQRKKLTNSRE